MVELNSIYVRMRFKKYLDAFFANDKEAYEKVKLLTMHFNKVYIYSGIIRDFFMGIPVGDVKDLDITVDNTNISNMSELTTYGMNILHDMNFMYDDEYEYDGDDEVESNYASHYLSLNNDKEIQLWLLKKSWTIQDVPFYERNIHTLFQHGFFNTYSIAYNLNTGLFEYNDMFIEFLKNLSLHLNKTIEEILVLPLFQVKKNLEKAVELWYNKNLHIGDDVINIFRNRDKYVSTLGDVYSLGIQAYKMRLFMEHFHLKEPSKYYNYFS